MKYSFVENFSFKNPLLEPNTKEAGTSLVLGLCFRFLWKEGLALNPQIQFTILGKNK